MNGLNGGWKLVQVNDVIDELSQVRVDVFHIKIRWVNCGPKFSSAQGESRNSPGLSNKLTSERLKFLFFSVWILISAKTNLGAQGKHEVPILTLISN